MTDGDIQTTNSAAPATLRIIIESTPCVHCKIPNRSSGAFLIGRLQIVVEEPSEAASLGVAKAQEEPLIIHQMEMRLVYEQTANKGTEKGCKTCNTQRHDISSWGFLTERLHLQSGVHDFPFTYELPGHLPTTTTRPLGAGRYMLVATTRTAKGKEFEPLSHQIHLPRSMLPGNEKASVRFFPPTELAAYVVLPSTVHPTGGFNVQMFLTGVVDFSKPVQTRWRLRNLMWKIEEHQTLVSTASAKQVNRLSDVSGVAGEFSKTRTVCQGEKKKWWRSIYDIPGGEITFVFAASMGSESETICDTFPGVNHDDPPHTTQVRHTLVTELTVVEEYTSNTILRRTRLTGAVRVLRMHFNLIVTGMRGRGMSWDKERPPVYEDVSEAPPLYMDERSVNLKPTAPGF